MAAALGQMWPWLNGSSGSPRTESPSTVTPQTASQSMQVCSPDIGAGDYNFGRWSVAIRRGQGLDRY